MAAGKNQNWFDSEIKQRLVTKLREWQPLNSTEATAEPTLVFYEAGKSFEVAEYKRMPFGERFRFHQLASQIEMKRLVKLVFEINNK